jgi:hypothetical protein
MYFALRRGISYFYELMEREILFGQLISVDYSGTS